MRGRWSGARVSEADGGPGGGVEVSQNPPNYFSNDIRLVVVCGHWMASLLWFSRLLQTRFMWECMRFGYMIHLIPSPSSNPPHPFTQQPFQLLLLLLLFLLLPRFSSSLIPLFVFFINSRSCHAVAPHNFPRSPLLGRLPSFSVHPYSPLDPLSETVFDGELCP